MEMRRQYPKRASAKRGHTTVLALVVALAAGLLMCSSEVGPPRKVILVGIDAADWKVMSDLLEDGRLPNFSRLISQGSTGRLDTFLPLRKSPILWTSIATSKLPDEHGIGGFVKSTKTGETVPYTGNVRKVKALWDILGEQGMTVAVVGWMVTWPAEPVNGYLVSDYIQYEIEDRIKVEKQTYPEELFEEIDALRLKESDMVDDRVAHIFPTDRTLEQMGVPEWQKTLVKKIFATDETFRRVAHHLDDKGVDFLTVYFNGVDSMCHAFWDQRANRSHPLHEVIDNYYLWIDGVLGEFIDMVDDETLLVVCSDHGFHGSRTAPDGGLLLGIYMHGEYGIVGMMGKGVRKGARIIDAGILDITPTILYALGLPVGRDMRGRVLTEGFESDFLMDNPTAFVQTYETGERVAGEPIPSPLDEEIKKKLKAVGYMQ
jgi:predicted AlkP superfamily phosphohydrolase/phosphomutase